MIEHFVILYIHGTYLRIRSKTKDSLDHQNVNYRRIFFRMKKLN